MLYCDTDPVERLRSTGFFLSGALRAKSDSSKLINTFSNLGRCYAEMGLLEEEQGHHSEAKMYFEEGLKVSQKVGNAGSEALCNESLAIYWGNQKNYVESEKHLEAAFEIYERSNNLPMISSVLLNLGMLASEQGKNAEAIDWLEQGRKIAQRLGNHAHVVVAANGLAQLYLDNGQSKKALQLIHEVTPVLDSVELLPVQKDFYHNLSEVYKANGMWQQALEATTQYNLIRDSLFSEEQKAAFVELKTQYEVAEKEQELNFQKTVIQQQRIWQWALGVGLVLAGVVGKKKFVYDIWGDTVNTATRMEQYGTINEVNISSTLFQELKDVPEFEFEYRGELEVKGKGKLGMYFARERGKG